MLSTNAVADLTKNIAREIAAPNADQTDQNAAWPEASIRTLLGEGLGGLVVPERFGGQGHGTKMLTEVCEILGSECASTAICFGMHSVGASVIAANPTDSQQEQYLSPIVSGKHITTLSLSEAGTGAHFYLPQTQLEVIDQGYSINGTKTFVTNGENADSFVVSAVASEPDAPMGQFSCVVVPNHSSGMEWGPPWQGMGMRGNSSRSLSLNNVVVPRHNLLGKEGDQIWYIFNVVCPYFLVAIAGTYLGIMNAALEEVKAHLVKRHHTHVGLTLAQAPVLQHRLGEMWGKVEKTRRLVYHAADSFDQGDSDALIALMSAKAEVADAVVDIVNDAMTMVGGISYRDGSRLHRNLRDARASHLMSPTTDILRVWIGRALLGQPLLAD
ncbi:MAG: acyl-CoA/acyl-ACP dehydrogenase [Acidiferrobacterales bacterium]|nr:acyl-CoA/acyl-ACP dehydrogenase [Acidiferrobacterales bacterium]